MGRSYWYECSKCGYRCQVSGGADRGLRFAVQTVLCRDCRALHDAVVRVRVPEESLLDGWRNVTKRAPRRYAGPQSGPPPTFQEVLNQLPPKGVRRFRWVQYKPTCPVSRMHRVEPWNEPDVCPRCGVLLEKNALPFRLWD